MQCNRREMLQKKSSPEAAQFALVIVVVEAGSGVIEVMFWKAIPFFLPRGPACREEPPREQTRIIIVISSATLEHSITFPLLVVVGLGGHTALVEV